MEAATTGAESAKLVNEMYYKVGEMYYKVGPRGWDKLDSQALAETPYQPEHKRASGAVLLEFAVT